MVMSLSLLINIIKKNLLIISKVLLIQSEKRFEDYKIHSRETSEVTRKKFTKIVKSEEEKTKSSFYDSLSFHSASN